jgi:hypothetical protein
MPKSNQIFKAIETKYHGYKFRSRLEARWAVFLDELMIDYRYEPEGYVLEEAAYLPDFYLPGHHCFLEIKGKRPTVEEIEKTRLLALYTGEDVCTLFGDIWLPNESMSYNAYRYTSPKVYAYPLGKQSGEELSYEVQAPKQIKHLLQKLHEHNIRMEVQDGLVILQATQAFPNQAYNVQNYLNSLHNQEHIVLQLAPLLEKYQQEILRVLTPETGWRHEFHSQTLSWDLAWAECSSCGNLALIANARDVDFEEALRWHRCSENGRGSYCYDSPKLIKAYTKAREARF